jgi:hypothetical protein
MSEHPVHRFGGVVAAVCFVTFLGAAGVSADQVDGHIYGTVNTTAGNQYVGVIRWGGEEAFWDDLLHSGKMDLPHAEYAEQGIDESEDRWWKALGRKIQTSLGEQQISRLFIARFGDVQSIEVTGRHEAKVTMRNGSTYLVSGYANDVGASLTVADETQGDVEVPWEHIESVVFGPTAVDATPGGTRLFGTVETRSGAFTGFIQWDEDECLSHDMLDGDTDDGRMSIPMGTVATIERRNASSARVVLEDGREYVLDGTNDVDEDIRGILIEDPRYGRVNVSWDQFVRVDFTVPPNSGTGYDQFDIPTRLKGTVTEKSGKRHTGYIIYDLDESESWELLNGGHDGIDYLIPFGRVRSIERRGSSSVIARLDNDEELRMDEGQDVSKRNAGVVVEVEGGGEVFVAWHDLRRIDFVWK